VSDASEVAMFSSRRRIDCVVAVACERPIEIERTLSNMRARTVRVVPSAIPARKLAALLSDSL
jgi:hypothetical protein